MILINNFSISRAGYQVLTPCYDYGFRYVQECLPEKKIFLTKYFCVAKGVDAPGNYFDQQEMNRFINYLVDLIMKHPEQVEELHQKTYRYNDELMDHGRTLLQKDFSLISNEALGKIYYELIQKIELAHLTAASTTWFVDSEHQQLSTLLMEKVKGIVQQYHDTLPPAGQKLDPAQAFSLLTTLPKNTFVLEEERESLIVLELICQDELSKKIIQELSNLNKIPDSLPENIKSAILTHYKKWRWTPFDYMGPAYTIDYYLTIWQGLLKQKINISEEIKKIVERPKRIEQERNQLIKRLNISAKDIRLLNLAADIAYLKGYRKDATFFAYYVLSFIYKEMAKRMNFSLNQIHLLSYVEIMDYFIDRKEISIDELNKRLKTTIINHQEGKGMQILTGKEAEQFLSEQEKWIKKEIIDTSISELKGTTACSGKAKGVVKIINHTEDMKKMEEGNIMVSHTTFPSLVPAMKKASAIITEDGGITCHAAIVSREMNTPCITGIKTATKVLNDGDLIEVDAGTGLVKIIQRAK